jgi:aminoglycoside phosphotransferase (APT) family kinase protein
VSDPVAAAVAAARDLGLPVDDPVALDGAANAFVHLRPAPVVARVSLTLRRGVEALEAELAFARAADPHVVPPFDARVIERDGLHVTFWRYVEHRRTEPADAPAVGRALRDLHDVVRGADLQLVPFDRLDEVQQVASELDHPDRQLMLEAIEAARARLAQLDLTVQPIHGDAHLRNALVTDRGPLWADLENVCRGPVEYDLACMAWRTKVHGWDGGPDALAAYGSYDAELVEALQPVLAAFLVPWNAKILQRLGQEHLPFFRQRVEYLKTFV